MGRVVLVNKPLFSKLEDKRNLCYGSVVELVNTSASHAEEPEFEPPSSHQKAHTATLYIKGMLNSALYEFGRFSQNLSPQELD